MSVLVAIDGPSASGKSTVARECAARLGFKYVDSGALYRGVTWYVLRAGIAAGDRAGTLACLPRIRWELFLDRGAVRFRLDAADPGEELRSASVRERVSEMAAIPEVRAEVTRRLRASRSLGDLVMEGRDIGTVVFPDADFKFYLDASPAERARRRHAELVQRQEKVELDRVQDSLLRRDAMDCSRQEAPLRIAPGAEVIDTTGVSIDVVVGRIAARVRPSPGEGKKDGFCACITGDSA